MLWLVPIAPFAALAVLAICCVGVALTFGALFHLVWDAPDSLSTGALYDPETNQWTVMASENAPSGRYNPYAFWTGDEMLVWGGFIERADFPVNDTVAIGGGGLYNPEKDAWRKMSSDGDPGGRRDAVVVWTGSELYVWGGIGKGGRDTKSRDDGAIYNLATDTWRQMTEDGAPSPRFNSVGVWTGTELIVWGGNTAPPRDTGCGNYASDGARYDPATNRWTALPAEGAPNGRSDAVAVWTGREALFVGGDTGAHGCPTLATAGRFSPSANSWFEMSPMRPAFDSIDGTAWTGSELVVWGTSLPPFKIIPETPVQLWSHDRDEWLQPSNPEWFMDSPHFDTRVDEDWLILDGPARDGLEAEHIVALLHIPTRQWMRSTTAGMPPGEPTIAAWNDQLALVLWSVEEVPTDSRFASADNVDREFVDSGWLYDARLDRWRELPAEGRPKARIAPAVVWTGSEFIVWGGLDRD